MIVELLLALFATVIRAKQFVLIPYNSELCTNVTRGVHQYQEFTISQQINLHTQSNVSEVESTLRTAHDNGTRVLSYLSWPPQIEGGDKERYYLCRALLKPMGRPLDVHNERGEYSFWNVRIRIDFIPGRMSCNDYLLLQFRHKENLVTKLEGHSAKTINITCRDTLPIIVPSALRKLYLTYFSSDLVSSGYVVNVTSFIFFQGDFPTQYRQDLCRRQDGFWCVNETVCIFREMKCDGFDSCFDGGSDEEDCGTTGNFTVPTPGDKRPKPRSGFIEYLPWLALGILPLILLLALICICNQHRSEVYFDEEEDNLDLEKSHDGDDMWSSMDGLEKGNGEMEDDCDVPCSSANNHGQDPPINLMPLNSRPETTKADISASRTLQSLNRDYEDIDQATVSPASNTDQSEGMTNHVEDPLTSGIQDNGIDRKQNVMYMSQMTDDDYEDHLEDVGSLLRKVDKSKIPEEVRLTANRPPSLSSSSPDKTTQLKPENGAAEYRSDYILV